MHSALGRVRHLNHVSSCPFVFIVIEMVDPIRDLAGVNLCPRIHREISSSLNSLVRELLLFRYDESFVSRCFVDLINIVIRYSQWVSASLSPKHSYLSNWLGYHGERTLHSKIIV